MRSRDDKKHNAICDSAIALITANGFSDTSISKIARAADVSPATIYVYFENKEDLLNKVYLSVKAEMSGELLKGVRPEMPVEETFRTIWHNFHRYAIENPVRFAFTEQFANSPIVDRVCLDESANLFRPLLAWLTRGIEQGVFKNVSAEVFTALAFAPMIGLIKQQTSGMIDLDEATLDLIYRSAWNAVAA